MESCQKTGPSLFMGCQELGRSGRVSWPERTDSFTHQNMPVGGVDSGDSDRGESPETW